MISLLMLGIIAGPELFMGDVRSGLFCIGSRLVVRLRLLRVPVRISLVDYRLTLSLL